MHHEAATLSAIETNGFQEHASRRERGGQPECSRLGSVIVRQSETPITMCWATTAPPLEPIEVTEPMFRKKYRLSDHIAACRTGEYVVLLDCKRDEYFGLSMAECELIRPHVEGLPESATSDFESYLSEPIEDIARYLNRLCDQRIICAYSIAGPKKDGLQMPQARADLIPGYSEAWAPLKFTDLRCFVSAVAWARYQISFNSILRMAANIERMRSDAGSGDTCDLDLARSAVVRFDRLYRVIFSRPGACLFRSFALQRFLFHYGIYPYSVFGVATNPFRAHCWVQVRDIVFSDSYIDVARFTPIFVT